MNKIPGKQIDLTKMFPEDNKQYIRKFNGSQLAKDLSDFC